MGYRSDVRIIVSKKGYEELSKYVENYIADNQKNYDYEIVNMLKEALFTKERTYETFTGEKINYIYIGWNYVKWADLYPEIDAIRLGLKSFVEGEKYSYRISIIGEYITDISEDYYNGEEDGDDLPFPNVIREFDDDDIY